MRLALLLLLAPAAFAQEHLVTDPGAPWPTNVDMPRSSAMGGAHAAIATGNDAMVVNPAGLAAGRRYHFELDGVYDSKFPAQGVMASVVDSSTAAAGSGLLFSRWGSGQPDGRGEGWLLGLGYAYPVAEGVFAGGVTKYTRFRSPDFTARWAEDIGVLSRHGGFTWAAVMQNISTEPIPLFPLTSTLGFAWGADTDWHLAFDYKMDLSHTDHIKHRYNVGAEVLVGQSIALRGGASRDVTAGQWSLSAGVGFLTERGGLQLVWRRRVTGPYDQFFEAGVTIYLE